MKALCCTHRLEWHVHALSAAHLQTAHAVGVGVQQGVADVQTLIITRRFRHQVLAAVFVCLFVPHAPPLSLPPPSIFLSPPPPSFPFSTSRLTVLHHDVNFLTRESARRVHAWKVWVGQLASTSWTTGSCCSPSRVASPLCCGRDKHQCGLPVEICSQPHATRTRARVRRGLWPYAQTEAPHVHTGVNDPHALTPSPTTPNAACLHLRSLTHTLHCDDHNEGLWIHCAHSFILA